MHCLALISVVDPLLVDLVALALHGEDALVLTASLHAGPDAGPGTDLSAAPGSVTAADAPGDPGLADGFIRLTAAQVPLDAGTAPVLDIARTTDCWTCSLREVLLAVVEDRARLDPDGATVVLLPPGVELIHLAPRLADDLARLPGVTLAGLAHVIDVDAAARDLLTHRPAPESVAVVEDQCAGELHMVALGYADAVVALGRDPVGRDLVEHLRPHDTLLLPGLDAPLLPELLALRHDAARAVARVHPATTRAWGGPAEHGVRTLDLFSEMPFHPGRLRELVEDLAGRGMLARGCFWLPSRPGRVCTWEVAGGAVSVGDAGTWDEAPEWDPDGMPGGRAPDGGIGVAGPRCHLVVTGLGDAQMRERVRQAFGRVLLREDEMAQAMSWIGADDGLGDWFGS